MNLLTKGTGEGARPPGDVGSWKLEAGRSGQVGGSLALSSLSVQSLWIALSGRLWVGGW
jgi:hypothetical protein